MSESVSFLLNSQKAELFNIIVAHELNPSSFAWVLIPEMKIAKIGVELRYSGTEYFFRIIPQEDGFRLHLSPDKESVVASASAPVWETLREYFNYWLIFLKRELTTPDPWADVAQKSASISLAPAGNAPNTPFFYQELQGIWKGLTIIQETLLNQGTDAEKHRHLIESQMAFLVESSKTMGRKDWLILAVGSLVTIATAMSLSLETTKAIFRLLKNAVAGLFNFWARRRFTKARLFREHLEECRTHQRYNALFGPSLRFWASSRGC